MNAKGKSDLNGVKQELRGIIRELQGISQGIRRDFQGIGNDICANAVDSVIAKYQIVLRQLNGIDTSHVSENARAGGGSGGGGGRSF